MFGHEKALKEMLGLNKYGVSVVLAELLRAKKIDYAEISRMYVESLVVEKNESSKEIMPLALHLARAIEGHLDIEEAKKLLWEKGYFQTSKYGEKLDKEFRNKQS